MELSEKENVRIAPADGKLGILIPGIGAVSTTFMAGVEAVKRGLAQPIGSLTQLSTIRLGKRTEGRTPLIKDFVPLAGLDDLVFGGWDIFEDSAYEAAANAKVLDAPLLEQVKRAARGHQADEGRIRSRIRQAHQRPEREAGRLQNGQGRDADAGHRGFPAGNRHLAQCDDLVRRPLRYSTSLRPVTNPCKTSSAGCRKTIPRSRRARSTLMLR